MQHIDPSDEDTAVSHSSEDVFSQGESLIRLIEQELEHILKQPVGLRYMRRMGKQVSEAADMLHTMFTLHSDYSTLNMKRQQDLITDVDPTHRGFLLAEISVIESQKQTIERLLNTYTSAVFAKQSELAGVQSNALSLFSVLVAIIALAITNFRLHALIH